ncbi:hypothetical protein KL86PLE_110016 [uncultured Pleomorphomonas sp.]|uniref:Uncharacterized protein n=1 Tax=uncultured Pleomorphomonas sp. TaxID=442121 RepID=A0A212L751_9HYPH|nr:hypothetical protein KL86PLE_110016 [uncultured Pleomorphomonas sp.]
MLRHQLRHELVAAMRALPAIPKEAMGKAVCDFVNGGWSEILSGIVHDAVMVAREQRTNN